jgi:xanthine dehydrogenase accessory factor
MQLEVTRELARMVESGEPFAIATLVDAHGSTPQKVGARLLVRGDGTTIGTLGGGCIEAEVWEVARGLIGTGKARLLDFTLNEDIAIDYGLACGGTEEILVDASFTSADREIVNGMLRGAQGESRALVLTPLKSGSGVEHFGLWEDGTRAGHLSRHQDEAERIASRLLEAPRPRAAIVTIGDTRYYADVFAEPPEVVIIGGGHVGKCVATVATFLGFRVAVIDDREDFANRERFPDATTVIAGDIEPAIDGYPMTRNSAIIIVTRGHKYDYQALSAAARSGAGYVGLMGSRRKVTLIYRQLQADGVPAERLRDIHAPIGLDIGAVTPQEIAVSILAELIAVKHGKLASRDAADISLRWLPPQLARRD